MAAKLSMMDPSALSAPPQIQAIGALPICYATGLSPGSASGSRLKSTAFLGGPSVKQKISILGEGDFSDYRT